MKKYQKLKTQYPENISLEQLRLICKISKRSARYLVENSIIPSIDTGRSTWKYKIAIDDVIKYLQMRDLQGSMIPTGAASSRKPKNPRGSFSRVVTPGQEEMVVEYFHKPTLTVPMSSRL